jgi:hypothetical protein
MTDNPIFRTATKSRGWRILRTTPEIIENPARDHTPPNGYAPELRAAAELADAITPDIDPSYHPHGAAPDGYTIALAVRQLAKETR